jgi:septum site-determining protein MinC
MTALPVAIAPSPLELKSAALPLVALVLRTADPEVVAAEVEACAGSLPGLFDGEPVVVDLMRLRDDSRPIDFIGLLSMLRRHAIVPVAVRGGNPAQTAAAREAGLLEAPEGGRPVLATPIERLVEVQLPPKPPLIIDRPLRSGQQVYARDRDLIVLALVSHGAEVAADGHIHVYAPLRGRAMAGAGGCADARIFSTQMEAQLLSIAGLYRTTDEPLPPQVAGRPAMAWLAEGSLRVDPLGAGA